MTQEETGWVIEVYHWGVLYYWDGRGAESPRGFGWTDKHEKAIRFARESDAQVVQGRLLNGAGRVTQHAWIGPEPSAPPPPEPVVRWCLKRPDGTLHHFLFESQAEIEEHLAIMDKYTLKRWEVVRVALNIEPEAQK